VTAQEGNSRFRGNARPRGALLENHAHGLSREGFGSLEGIDLGVLAIDALIVLGQVNEALQFVVTGQEKKKVSENERMRERTATERLVLVVMDVE
jgi:hypothetical protein